MNRVEPQSSPSVIDESIEAATRGLFALQQRDGHWVFELEADATIPAEYILLRHYLAALAPELARADKTMKVQILGELTKYKDRCFPSCRADGLLTKSIISW